jgi:hypothetical protein
LATPAAILNLRQSERKYRPFSRQKQFLEIPYIGRRTGACWGKKWVYRKLLKVSSDKKRSSLKGLFSKADSKKVPDWRQEAKNSPFCEGK